MFCVRHRPQHYPGEFAGIDSSATFFSEAEVAGVSVLKDDFLVRDIHSRMGQFSRGPSDFFPANWPVSICLDNMQLLEQPYIVAPKVKGPRYLLYIDRLGDIYMENSTQQIFQVDERYTVHLPSSGRSALKDTVLDGIFTQKIRPDDQSSRFAFVVHDSFRCNGVDLAARGIEERLGCVQVNVPFKPL